MVIIEGVFVYLCTYIIFFTLIVVLVRSIYFASFLFLNNYPPLFYSHSYILTFFNFINTIYSFSLFISNIHLKKMKNTRGNPNIYPNKPLWLFYL